MTTTAPWARASSTVRAALPSTCWKSSPCRRRSCGSTTFPTSNMGEPHTQEHLLLGKGNKGRAVASLRADGARQLHRLHHAVAHLLQLLHPRRRGSLLRPDREAPRRPAAPRLHRRGDPARGAQLRRHREPARQDPAPGGEGHRLQRDGQLDGPAAVPHLPRRQHHGLRARAPAGVQLGRVAGSAARALTRPTSASSTTPITTSPTWA